MNETLEGALFLCIWIGFLALMLVSITAILVWAVRSRQFMDQNRARYLPLDSGIPSETRDEVQGNRGEA